MCIEIKTKKTNGFSLVEIIVVMAIVSIMAGVAFVVGGSGNAEKDVDTATQMIAAQIKNLQSEALIGKKIPDGLGNMVSACRFVFDTNPANNSYSIIYDRNCSGAANVIGQAAVTDLAEYKVETDDVSITFISPRGELLSSQQIRVFSSKNSSIDKYIEVNSVGVVEINDNP